MKKNLLILLFAIAAGLYVLNWQFRSLSLVHPTFVAWLGGGDWEANFLSWHFFRHEPWSFPLGRIAKLGYPSGTSVALTDPTPIFAYPFRLFSAWLPADFQYAGIWFTVCFVLQALFGAWLVELLTPNIILIFIGSFLFTLSPILLQRVRHISLCAHWLILAFLWLYFQKRERTKRDFVFLYALNFIGWWSHPYLGGILSVLSICALFRWSWRDDRLDTRRFIQYVLTLFLFDGIHFYIGGYLSNPLNDMQTNSWGDCALHLNSLFLTMSYSNFTFLPYTYPDPGTEFMYLGVGLIALAAMACILYYRRDAQENFCTAHMGERADFTTQNMKPLLITCAALTMFALSNRIYLDHTHVILRYPLPHFVLHNFGMFRDCGRFFWPCYYLIIYFSIAMTLKHYRRMAAGGILLAVLGLQFYEFYHVICPRPLTTVFPMNSPLKDKFWDHLERFKGIEIFPNTLSINHESDFFFFSYLAASRGMFITAIHAARYKHAQDIYFLNSENMIKGGTMDPSTLYIIPDRFVSTWSPYLKKMAQCSRIDEYYVCFQPNRPNAKIEPNERS